MGQPTTEPDDWACQQVGYHLPRKDEHRIIASRHTAAECRAMAKPDVTVTLTNGEVQYLMDLLGVDSGPESHAPTYGVDAVTMYAKFAGQGESRLVYRINGSPVVLVYNQPGDEGAAYTLRLQDGKETVISDGERDYMVLADVIDRAFGDTESLPEEHLDVLQAARDECWRNVENSDVHTRADVAADIIRWLAASYLPVGDPYRMGE